MNTCWRNHGNKTYSCEDIHQSLTTYWIKAIPVSRNLHFALRLRHNNNCIFESNYRTKHFRRSKQLSSIDVDSCYRRGVVSSVPSPSGVYTALGDIFFGWGELVRQTLVRQPHQLLRPCTATLLTATGRVPNETWITKGLSWWPPLHTKTSTNHSQSSSAYCLRCDVTGRDLGRYSCQAKAAGLQILRLKTRWVYTW